MEEERILYVGLKNLGDPEEDNPDIQAQLKYNSNSCQVLVKSGKPFLYPGENRSRTLDVGYLRIVSDEMFLESFGKWANGMKRGNPGLVGDYHRGLVQSLGFSLTCGEVLEGIGVYFPEMKEVAEAIINTPADEIEAIVSKDARGNEIPSLAEITKILRQGMFCYHVLENMVVTSSEGAKEIQDLKVLANRMK